MLRMRTTLCALLGAASVATIGTAVQADAPPANPATIPDAVAAGKPILEVRARYEDVDQANLADRADSLSVRTRFGWQTATWQGLQALVEGDNTFHLDDGHYNVAVPGGASLNGKTQYPIINDPDATRLNRAQISWTPGPAATFTVGRQRLLIDDQRFVGNVGWRPNEQTFDAAGLDFKSGPLKATYDYVFRVNRIFGGPLDWASDSHLLNASYAFAPPLHLEAFAYALDFTNAAANSTLTVGARLSGKAKAGPVGLTYDATFANERNYRNNPARFSLDYWQADVAATYGILTAKADYEWLQGNGVQGFITPLGTTHGFQGWADAFAADSGNKTEVDGVRDANISLILRPKWKLPFLSNVEALVRYHDFDAELTGAYLAHEWDAQVQGSITRQTSLALKVADYERAASVPAGTVAAPPSRTKVWLTLEYRL